MKTVRIVNGINAEEKEDCETLFVTFPTKMHLFFDKEVGGLDIIVMDLNTDIAQEIKNAIAELPTGKVVPEDLRNNMAFVKITNAVNSLRFIKSIIQERVDKEKSRKDPLCHYSSLHSDLDKTLSSGYRFLKSMYFGSTEVIYS